MATAFDGKATTLESLDRYERRAFSKRQRSLRKLGIAFRRTKRTPDLL